MEDDIAAAVQMVKGAGLSVAGLMTGLPISVNSEAIAWVAYSLPAHTLTIQLRASGKSLDANTRYEYKDVPVMTYIGLMTASSKGRYYNANIKGRY